MSRHRPSRDVNIKYPNKLHGEHGYPLFRLISFYGVIVDRRTSLAETRDSPREAQRRDARLPRSCTLQIMPHCRKRSSSTRPGGRGGNGDGNGDDTRRNVDAKHASVTEDDEDHEAGS